MINLWRSNLRQRGQIAIMMAAGFAGLLGMTGVAVDLGFAYVHRREAQNAADAAAAAGTTKLAQHYEALDGVVGGPATQNDSDIKTAVLCALNGALPPFTDISAGCSSTALPANASAVPMPPSGNGPDGVNYAWYVTGETPSGCAPASCTATLGPAVGSGSIPTNPAAVGVRVMLRYSYPTFFAKVIGMDTINVQASARSMLRPTNASSVLASAGPFIVCGGNGTAGSPGAMDLTANAAMQQIVDTSTSPPTVKTQYYGDTFLIHGSHLGDASVNGDCGITNNQYKGLADTTQASACTSLPCNMPYLTGDKASTPVNLLNGLPTCGADQSAWNNCVLILPIADSGDNSTGTLHVVTFQPFLMGAGAGTYGSSPTDPDKAATNGCNSSNCNVGTLLSYGVLTDLTAGTGTITVTSSGFVTSGTFAVQSQPE